MDVVVGRIVKVHGIRGELAVEVRTDSPQRRFAPGIGLTARSRDGSGTALTVESTREHGDRLLVRFAEIADRDAAEGVRGRTLCLDTSELEELDDPDEFHDHQLAGLRVELTDGTFVGTVAEVVHAPGGELLAIDREGESTVLVPFVRQIVIEVAIDRQLVRLDPPEGLLDVE